MVATKFLSSGNYIVLPTKSQPKVYLSFYNKSVLQQAFKLYNPFSYKAKLYKWIVVFATKYLNTICPLFLPVIKVEQSEFSKVLNSTLNKNITISSYIATERDKIVLQLQDQNGVYGYLKYPISALGTKRLLNEKNGITIMSELGIAEPLKFVGEFEGIPFFILENIEGEIGDILKMEYDKVLFNFKKNIFLKLERHPRVLKIQNQLDDLGFMEYTEVLKQICAQSKKEYQEVYEHGDFAPWNLIRTSNGIVPFDFEYFEAQGLEYLDELKFLFQVGALLKKLEGRALITYIHDQSQIEEFESLFQIFLLKEVINKTKVKESITNEVELLKLIATYGAA